MTEFDFRNELVKARAYSRSLRHLLRAGLRHLEPLTYEEELCRWDGPLLPLEECDRYQTIPRNLVEHGTERGYQWHRRHGERACDECRLAHNAMTRASKAKSQRKKQPA